MFSLLFHFLGINRYLVDRVRARLFFSTLANLSKFVINFFQHLSQFVNKNLTFLASSRFLTICCRFLSILFDFFDLVCFAKISFVGHDESDKSFCQTCWVGQTILSDLIGLTKYFVRLNILSDFKNLD